MNKTKTDRTTLKRFGLIMASGLSLLALLILFKHKQASWPVLTISLFFLLVTLIIPNILKYPYIIWMKFAFILGWVNTRILLCIIFYLVFTPVGLFMRLFKIDPLERKFNRSSASYWKTRNNQVAALKNYERRF